jgi:phosphatidate cytidylyltransferase
VNLNNLQTRTFTGAAFAAAIIACIFISRTAFAWVMLAASLVALSEFLILRGIKLRSLVGYVVLVFGGLSYFAVALIALLPSPAVGLQLGILTLFVPVLLMVSLYSAQPNPLETVGSAIIGIFYIPIPLALLNFFNDPVFMGVNQPKYMVLGFFLLVWANDTFAYLTGITFGKHSLFKRISPKKTWEGSIGGAILTIAFSYLIFKYLGVIGLIDWMIVAALIIIFGTFGDLSESMIKRLAQVKDSGNILPGHGGMLDRFDAVLFAAPVVFLYLLIAHTFFS